jgi:hypothetical protein
VEHNHAKMSYVALGYLFFVSLQTDSVGASCGRRLKSAKSFTPVKAGTAYIIFSRLIHVKS